MGTGAKEYAVPEWLTSTFMEDVLKKHFEDDTLKVLSISSTSVNSKGLSFCAIMHRVSLQVERNGDVQSLSVIIKEHPKDTAGIIATKNQLFQREISVYNDILPKVHQLLESLDDRTRISPICYFTTSTPEVMLILEDMNAKNYDMFEKSRLLNLEHVLPVVHKIAKLHACSAVIAEKDPKIMEQFLEGVITDNPDRQDFLGFFPANMKSLAIEVEEWKGFEEIAEKLRILERTIIPKAVEMYKADDKIFRVLNLGDLWVNNLMFQCNDDLIPEDVVLFDYQLAYYGSPAIDLNYLLFGSLNENVRKVHFKFIVHEYHRHLADTLQRLNFKGTIPTLRDIHIEIIRKSLHAVIAAVCLTPILLMECERVTELEALFDRSDEGNALRKANIENPKYKVFIQRTLKELELSGFLD